MAQHPLSATLYLATVEVRMDGDLRDVRTSPESPAPWPDELSNPSFRCCSLQFPLLTIISPGTGLIARSTHLFIRSSVVSRQWSVLSHQSLEENVRPVWLVTAAEGD
jgi:hypothetical protein